MASNPRNKLTEAQVTAEIIKALIGLGYLTPRQAVASGEKGAGYYLRCQNRDARNAGSDAGMADIWVWPHHWGKWLALEVKRPAAYKAKIYPEQKLLMDCSATYMVTSADDVLGLLVHPGGYDVNGMETV